MQTPSTQTSFSDLALSEPILRAVRAEKYETPTPIQVQAIPHLLAGRDLLGCAQTGTGKTAAFALPILQRLSENRRAAGARGARTLVLTPTRELAAQIAESFRVYGRHVGLTHAVVYGGVGHAPQIRALTKGVDILVATPGRLLDHMQAGHVRLSGLEILVLDEADRMLDMGFIRDIGKILAVLPKARQTLLFSATMPADIAALASTILVRPARVEATPVASTVERIEQRVVFLDRAHKLAALAEVLRGETVGRALVFTRTKRGANRVAELLERERIAADAIHGNKSQGARQRALDNFRSGRCRVLVATDIAARGIDVDGVTHVINYELPNEPESYVHRIGRTARAGAEGVAISLCDGAERALLKDIERLIRVRVPELKMEGLRASAPERAAPARASAHPRRNEPRRAEPSRNGRRTNEPRKAEPRRAEAPRKTEPRRAEPRRAETVRATPPPARKRVAGLLHTS